MPPDEAREEGRNQMAEGTVIAPSKKAHNNHQLDLKIDSSVLKEFSPSFLNGLSEFFIV